MEIKLNAGDKIQIPENCKATIEDNQIIIEEKQEEKQDEFKDGDILHSNNTHRVVIFESYIDKQKDYFCSYYNNDNADNRSWGTSYFHHATEEERQSFFDDLKAKGLCWNAKTKQMEKIRKRVPNGNRYLYIDHRGEVMSVIDFHDLYDNDRFKVGNYYLPEEIGEAGLTAKAIKAIFNKRLKM